MNFFARAVIYGFAFSLGAALYKRVNEEFDLDGSRRRNRDDRDEEKASDSAHPPAPAVD